MTKFTLFDSFVHGKKVMLGFQGKTHTGMINAIQREDGSGSCFIVTLHTGAKVFVRTID